MHIYNELYYINVKIKNIKQCIIIYNILSLYYTNSKPINIINFIKIM